MPVGAVVGAVAGGLIASRGAKKGGEAQAASADAATAEQRRQYDLTRQDQQPWLQAGGNALANLQDPNAFQQSPGYQFMFDEGQRALGNSLVAQGRSLSGAGVKSALRYGQGLASQEYGNWWNQQAGLAGVGQNAANSLGTFGANMANNVGQNMMQAGNARASSYAGQANALSGGIANGLNTWLYSRQNTPQPEYFMPTARRI